MFTKGRMHDSSSYAEYLRGKERRRVFKRKRDGLAAAAPCPPSESSESFDNTRATLPSPAPTADSPDDQAKGHSGRGRIHTPTRRPTSTVTTSQTLPGINGRGILGAGRLNMVRTRAGEYTASSARRRHTGKEKAQAKPVRSVDRPAEELTRTGPAEECCLCGKDISSGTKHPCMDCPMLFCPSCVVNLSILHPGHKVKNAHTAPSPTCSLCEQNCPLIWECQVCPVTVRLCADCRAFHPDHSLTLAPGCEGYSEQAEGERTRGHDSRPASPEPRERVEPLDHTGSEVSCFLCQRPILDVRYECQDCPVTANFCADCRELHTPRHRLKAKEHSLDTRAADDAVDHEGDGDGETEQEDATDEDREDTDEIDKDGHGDDGSSDDGPRDDDDYEEDPDGYDGAGSTPEDDRGCDGDGASDVENGREGDTEDDGRGDPDISHQSLKLGHGDHKWSPTTLHPARELDPRRRRRSQSQITVTFNKESLSQFASLARAVAGAADRMLAGTQATSHVDRGNNHRIEGEASYGSNESFDPDRLLDFIDAEVGAHGRRTQTPVGHHRWRSPDKKRLCDLKARGWTTEDIAAELKRTPSAISQQWRKLC